MNSKIKIISKVKINTIISEMSWCNALQRTGSDFCATDNFQGTLMTRRINLIKDFDITKY